jgi:peptidoglycan/LPS O-acetylase OafA/YrhL
MTATEADLTAPELGTDPSAPSPAVATTAAAARRHLHEIDVVRLLTFGSVIMVHALAFTNPGSSVPAGAALLLFHFTREAFFLLSAFVLFYSAGDRSPRLRSFWAKRFLAIGVPYLVWSVGYWLLNEGWSSLTAAGMRRLGVEVLSGTAEYHLYFLLVSMQLYLVFPLLLRLVRRTAGHHLALFVGSLALELALLAALHWTTWHGTFWTGLQQQAYVLLPTYQFYFVAGALAAVHRERFFLWVRGHPWTVAGVAVGGALLGEAAYLVQVLLGSAPYDAADPVQPVMVPWSVAVTVGIVALGCWYADHRRPGRLAAAVAQASLASFGVYLLHPLVLDMVLTRWLQPQGIPAPASTVLAWLVTLVASFAVVGLVIRSPLSVPLTGRRRPRGQTGRRRAFTAPARAPAG